MRLLHIFTLTNQQYSDAWIDFLKRRFSEHENIIVFRGKIDQASEKLKKETQIIFSDLKNASFFRFLKHLSRDCDYVFLHSLFYEPRFSYCLYHCKKILEKSVWIIWGSDFYSYEVASNKKGLISIKNFVCNRIQASLRKAIPFVVGDEVDYEPYVEKFGKKQTLFFKNAINPLGYDFATIDTPPARRWETLRKPPPSAAFSGAAPRYRV